MSLDLYPYVVFDTETGNRNKGSPFDDSNRLVSAAIILAEDPSSRKIFFNHTFSDEVSNTSWEHISKVLSRNDILLVGHNLKFDMHWAERWGCHLTTEKLWDTMFSAFGKDSLGPRRKLSLQALTKSKNTLGDILVHELGMNPEELPPSWIVRYMVMDVLATEKLFLSQYNELYGGEVNSAHSK